MIVMSSLKPERRSRDFTTQTSGTSDMALPYTKMQRYFISALLCLSASNVALLTWIICRAKAISRVRRMLTDFSSRQQNKVNKAYTTRQTKEFVGWVTSETVGRQYIATSKRGTCTDTCIYPFARELPHFISHQYQPC